MNVFEYGDTDWGTSDSDCHHRNFPCEHCGADIGESFKENWFGMPLCKHQIQFDCEQCWIEDLKTENRRMQWFLQMKINSNNGHTLWDQYKTLDEEFWEEQGL